MDSHSQFLVQEGVVFFDVSIGGAGVNPLVEWRGLFALRAEMRRADPDLVFSYTPKGNVFSAFAVAGSRAGLIPNISGLGRSAELTGALGALVAYLYRFLMKSSSWVFFQNGEDFQEFRDRRYLLHCRASRLPGSGVDLHHFSYVGQLGGRPARPRGFVALFVGRLLWAKGVGVFVDAIRLLRANGLDITARIAGRIESPSDDAVALDDIDRWVEEGLVEYVGEVSDVRSVLSEADCLVFPSVYREGVPRVLLEAAACGLPVVTTDWPGCRDAVEDGSTGFLCTPGSIKEFADAIRRLSDMSFADRRKMGACARRKMEAEFDEEIVLRSYLFLVDRYCVNPDLGAGDVPPFGNSSFAQSAAPPLSVKSVGAAR